jgi:hypothetical protein
LGGTGIFGIYLFLTFYLQKTLNFSPIATGAAFLPMVGGIMAITTVASATLLPRFGPKLVITAGMVVTAGAQFWLSYLEVGSSYATDVLPPLLIAGLGFGMVLAPAMQTATTGVRQSDAGVASATVNTMQQLGAAVGTALLSTIAGNAASRYLAEHGRDGAARAEAAVHSYTTAFVWGAVIFVVGAVICGVVLRPASRR